MRNWIKSLFLFICLIIAITTIITACKRDRDTISSIRVENLSQKSDTIQFRRVVFQTQWLHQSQFVGYYIAYKKGFYHNVGLDVEIVMGGPDNPSPQALVKKRADFVSMFLTSALREINEGHQLVNVAQISQKSSLLLVAKKNRGIEQLSDLNGKRIGLWVNDFREPSITLLNKHNINATIVPVSWTTDVLAHDVVDALNMMNYNEYDIFVKSGYDPEELSVFALSDYGVNIPEDGVYCTKEFYINNKQLCRDFAEATMDGWIYALNNENEALAIVLEFLKEAHLPTNIPHQKWMLQKIREAVLFKAEQFGILTEEDYNTSVNMLKKNKIITRSVPYADFIGYDNR